MGNSLGNVQVTLFSPGSDKLTEVQLYMSLSYKAGSLVIRAFCDVEKPSLFSDLAVKTAKLENIKKLFSVKEGSDKLPGKQVLLT